MRRPMIFAYDGNGLSLKSAKQARGLRAMLDLQPQNQVMRGPGRQVNSHLCTRTGMFSVTRTLGSLSRGVQEVTDGSRFSTC